MRQGQYEIISALKQLRSVAPQAEWVASSRELLLAEIRRQEATHAVPAGAELLMDEAPSFGWLRWLRQPVVGFAAALILVFGSALTVNAAFYSLPGEPLYRLKLAFERTQLVLVSDSTQKAELKVEFARNRVKELGKLVAQITPSAKSPQRVSQVVTRFTREVASVRQELSRLPSGERAVFKIAVSVDAAGTELAAQLQTVTREQAAQPEMAQAVRQALATAEETSQSALAAAIAAPLNATSSQALPPADVSRYLSEKVKRLREQLASHAAAGETAAAAEALDHAEAAIGQGAFAEALGFLNTAKFRLDQLMTAAPSAPPPAADPAEPGVETDATATSSVPLAPLPAGPAAEREPNPPAGEGSETTQNLLP